ncbi:MAG: carbamate kinase [Clostridiales bacterium]|jgi:carbamate kinase|nr:carbamate kinase [Clostridiales bacterium]
MGKKIVIALGGNALGNNLKEQMEAVKVTASAIVDMVAEGHQVVVAHGNGPQVGMLKIAMDEASKSEAKTEAMPLSVCVAMSQAYIGNDLQNALRTELLNRGFNTPVATIVTQTVVSKDDPAFQNPTKPIGSFYSKQEAEQMAAKGENMVEDSGRGWRKVVASPKPIDIIEKEVVKTMMEAGQIAISVGGGGIPVIAEGSSLIGAPAVVDKDFASALLAKEIGADTLIILTAVEKVAINFGKPNEEWLDEITIADAQKYIEEGHFAPGSMLPKVMAAMGFVSTGGDKVALITLLGKAKEGISGKTGTRIVK